MDLPEPGSVFGLCIFNALWGILTDPDAMFLGKNPPARGETALAGRIGSAIGKVECLKLPSGSFQADKLASIARLWISPFGAGLTMAAGVRVEDGPRIFRCRPACCANIRASRRHRASIRKQRTLWNVRDSDATLIIGSAPCVSEGSAFTLSCAIALGKPHHLVNLRDPGAVLAVRAWIERARPETLNIAGPRESESRGVFEAATTFLGALF